MNEEYTRHMKKLTEKILGWLSEGLGLPPVTLTKSLGGEMAEYVIRVNFYPPSPKTELALGAKRLETGRSTSFLSIENP